VAGTARVTGHAFQSGGLEARGRRGFIVKKVIALKGISNVGKSQTIKKVYELLLKIYPSAKIEKKFIGVDITVVLSIGEIKIGIESQGDPNSRLRNSLAYFVEINCQIIICATRTYGQTVDAVNKLEGSYEIKWVDQTVKPILAEQEYSNGLVAKHIVEEVEKAIRA
jgi:hypothetical protein